MTSFTKCKSTTVFGFIFMFIINITSSYGLSECQKFHIGYSTLALHNLSIPTVSMFENQMDMVEYFYEIMPCTNHTIKVTEIPPTVSFVLLQAHSYLYDVALGYSPSKKVDKKVTGTNVGLVQMVDATGTAVFNLENKHVFSVSVLLAALYYGHNAPVPGGCNMEFEVKISPFMKLHYTSSLIEVNAQPAQIPKSWISSYNIWCMPDQLQYETYLFYLPQNDFSEESYFNGIRRMLSVKRIKQNGRKVIAPSGQLRSRYSTYYGTGSVYAMIVTAGNLEHAAYVPVHTYSCSPEFNSDTCFERSFYSNLSCFLLGVLGIFLCFFGNKHSGQEMVVMFGLFVAIIVHVILMMDLDSTKLSDQESAAISIIFGLIIGEIFLFIVKSCDIGIVVIAYLVDAVVLGVLLASAVFYTPISDHPHFDDFHLYWLFYFIIVLIVTILMLLFDKMADRLAPAIVGAYTIVLCLEFFVYSNLRYIIINPIRQATVEGFDLATIAPPYQTVDLIMVLVWTVLSVLGVLFQPNKSFPHSPERRPILINHNNASNNHESVYGACADSNNESVFFSDSEPVETDLRTNLLVY